MVITTKQLRMAPGRIISQVDNGQEITITYRGKPYAKIIPFNRQRNMDPTEPNEELFGIWKERGEMENVEQYVRTIRKGRKFDN